MNKICIVIIFAMTLFPLWMQAQAIHCLEEEPLSEQERKVLARELRAWRQHKHVASRQALTDYSIPLVFHVLSSGVGQGAVEQAVSGLNLAFANAGQFNNDWGADTQLRFELACESPDGGLTYGVNFINSAFKIVDIDLEHQDLVNTIKWDAGRYLNVWVVDEISGEALADYKGSSWWTRLGIGGYASGDGIVITSLDVSLIAHEIGHYFGLLHTWQGRDCKNDDCLADGDLVCDTPPDMSVFDSCEDNSCNTDTLSNFSNNTFFSDTLDMGTNFMDYGNAGCSLDFSLGQAERMQFTIESGYPTLPYELRAESPCTSTCDDRSVQIEIEEEYPVVGSTLNFSGVATGTVTNYEWYLAPSIGTWTGDVTGDLIGTTADISTTIATEGYYTLFLRAWDVADETCVATTSVNIRVTCGVVARFSPDKRIIASKQPHALFTDSVFFLNRSDGATDFEWLITHENNDPSGTNLPNDTLSEENLTYYFREPGRYSITLTASEGGCQDVRGPFILQVDDPTMDIFSVISDVHCIDSESWAIDFTVFNEGYDTTNAIVPIAIFDANPVTDPSANYLGGGPLNRVVFGRDDEVEISYVLDRDLTGLDEIFLALNAVGTVPLLFPPGDLNKLSTETIFPETGFSELNYDNNVSSFVIDDETEFQETLNVCKGQLQTLLYGELVSSSLCWDSIIWNSNLQGALGTGEAIDYATEEDDQLEITLVATSGVRETGTINVFTQIPEYSVDTVFRIVRGNDVPIIFNAQGEYDYEWSPQDGIDDPFSGSVIAGPLENTLYSVTITDEFGCQTIQQIRVWVETTAHIPDLFTPNRDGNNDRLLIYDLLQVRSVLFRIVNKEGSTVYSSTSADELIRSGWDGDENGAPQPSGAYFWTVEGTYEDGRPIRFNQSQSNSGIIHLVR
ncbi:MAG: gliding motility-associated C-terminal domain-containing protein [Cytophagales bacterium]|nr:gliding motility-associated C-terminal domain-containing protein [Cytophagales bacterium]